MTIGNVNKGTVSAIFDGGRTAAVKPYTGEVVTVRLVVPFFLLDCLIVGMPVAYCTFRDNTGLILARMDGEWNHTLYDGVKVATGNLEVSTGDISTASVASMNRHTHTCPDGTTSGPN